MKKHGVYKYSKYIKFIFITIIAIFLIFITFSDKRNSLNMKSIGADESISVNNIALVRLELRNMHMRDIDRELLGMEYRLIVRIPNEIVKNSKNPIGFKILYPDAHSRLFGVESSGIAYYYSSVANEYGQERYSISSYEASSAAVGKDIDKLMEEREGFVVEVYLGGRVVKSINVSEEYVSSVI